MLFDGDDWARDHHDVELVDEDGKRLAYGLELDAQELIWLHLALALQDHVARSACR
jgi:hypothetical protein